MVSRPFMATSRAGPQLPPGCGPDMVTDTFCPLGLSTLSGAQPSHSPRARPSNISHKDRPLSFTRAQHTLCSGGVFLEKHISHLFVKLTH